MLSKKFISAFVFVLLGLGLVCSPSWAQCPIPQWSATVPQINQRHIFCGEINGGLPKGYHSKVYSPSTDVVTGTHDGARSPNGIYNGQVTFINHQQKSSTFFPDNCTQAQIIESVVYASGHPAIPPAPVVPWGGVGASAPAVNNAAYCVGTNGNPFNIRYATPVGGTINTAFPN